VVAAIGDLTQLLNGLIQVAALGGVPHGGSVESAAEQPILGDMLNRIECRFDYTIPQRWR
jgi:hypothetical protein